MEFLVLEGTCEVNGNSTVSVVVEPGGTQVVAHVGLHALGRFADRVGLPTALTAAVPWAGERPPAHARGKVLTQAMLMLAGGGESCADIEHLRVQDRLFGVVPSDSTLYRTVRHDLTPAVLNAVQSAFGGVRGGVWRRMAATTGKGPVVLDIDASLVQVHSQHKAGTGPTYKGGFGFHPMLCFADATGEALAAVLRPGNAGANTVSDHLAVLDAAIGQLPVEIAAGHHPGDDPGLARRAVHVRTDSAGCTHGFVHGCHERNVTFAVVARSNNSIHAAMSRVHARTEQWTPARRQAGDPSERAEVIDVTHLIDLTDWPDGTRLIVRRERLHPGAQHSLFDSTLWRYWGHYTNTTGSPVALDADMRAHAHVEDHIKRLKASGLERFPFTNLDANQAWLTLVCHADSLVRWFQHLCCTGDLARAEPKRLRWTLWHTPARIIRHAGQDIVRIIDDWPTTHDIVHAHARINALC